MRSALSRSTVFRMSGGRSSPDSSVEAALRGEEREVAAPQELPGQPAAHLADHLGRDAPRRPARDVDVDVGLVQRDGGQVQVPGPAEVRGHDGQPGMGGGHRVELERVGVVEPDALPAGLAGPDPAGPGMEQGQQAVLLAGREDRPVLRVVRGEGLQRRVELHPAQPERGDVRHLGHGRLALVRVHRTQPGEGVRVLVDGRGHGLVGDPGPARGRLGVPGQQDRLDPQVAVAGGQFLQRLPLHRRPEVGLGRLDVARHADVQPVGGGQMHVEVDGSERHPIIVTAALLPRPRRAGPR